ncbi:MAG: hypothetical protein IPK24_22115 [Kineosporiaceae bacterium]|nr:hypothetical protein [Kineosporiaceae bacterium]
MVVAPWAQAGGLDPSRCKPIDGRITIPSNFVFHACFDGTTLVILNRTSTPGFIEASGDVAAGATAPVAGVPQLPAALIAPLGGGILAPGFQMRLQVGAGIGRVSVSFDGEIARQYALASIAYGQMPSVTGIPAVFTDYIQEVDSVYVDYLQCMNKSNNFFARSGCLLGFSWDVEFAAGRLAVNGILTVLEVRQIVKALIAFVQISWDSGKAIGDLSFVAGAAKVLSVPARSALNAGGAPVNGQGPPGGTLTVSFSENPYRCDGGVRPLGTLSGAAAGERVAFASPQVSGLSSGTATASGTVAVTWQCDPPDVGTSWQVTATGQTSHRAITFVVKSLGAIVDPGNPPPTSPLSVSLSENPFRCDGGTRALGTLSGAAPGERITFSSPEVSNLSPGTASASGTLPLRWQCDPGDVGTTWHVTATGQSSGRRVTFSVGSVGTPAPPPPVQAAAGELFSNYGSANKGYAMCRGNPGNSLSMPGGTVEQTFTAPSGSVSVTSAMVQIDPAAEVTAHMTLLVNGRARASATAQASGDPASTSGSVTVSGGDSLTLRISFTATAGKIITVYTAGAPGGTFRTINSCPDGAPTVTRSDTGLRSVVYGTAR